MATSIGYPEAVEREAVPVTERDVPHVVWELSDYLTKRGRTQATPEFCKDLLKYTFLGFETKTFTDAITGEQQDVQQLRHTRDLKTADMFDFMTRVQAWAIDIGCFLTVEENC